MVSPQDILLAIFPVLSHLERGLISFFLPPATYLHNYHSEVQLIL